MILTHDNITQHVDEWAADYGIPADLITLRIGAGWTAADAIETEMPTTGRGLQRHKRELNASINRARRPRETLITHDGKTLSLRRWADEIGVKAATIHARLKLGMAIDRVLAPIDHRDGLHGVQPSIFITYRTITRSVSRWSRITGLKVATIRYRHAKGWPAARILAPELEKKPRHRGAGRASAVIAGTGALPTAQISA